MAPTIPWRLKDAKQQLIRGLESPAAIQLPVFQTALSLWRFIFHGLKSPRLFNFPSSRRFPAYHLLIVKEA